MTTKNYALPALTPEGGLRQYLRDIQKFPVLDADEEYALAKRWVDDGDYEAAHKLVTSHLRLVAKIAMGYRGYGLPVGDLIAEGNIGLMQAVKKFDPDKGFRLSTYAMWWVKAAIQEFVLRSWSLVKMGTSAGQKRLFFNLKKLKRRLHKLDDSSLTPDEVREIAQQLDVSEEDVMDMDTRMTVPDRQLNARMGNEEDGGEWMDMLADTADSQETVLAEDQELSYRREVMRKAMDTLNDRELHIIMERQMKDDPTTLEELSQKYGISRERVRQIESRALEKMTQYVVEHAKPQMVEG